MIAVLGLKLDKDAGPLPQDTTLIVRPRNALGLKYVELTPRALATHVPGRRHDPARAGAKTPVELDEFLNMFDAKTRAAAQANLESFGTAFAGRGESINTAIGAFRPLLRDVVPVMHNLAAPRTQLERFIHELGDTAAITAPVAETQASLFDNLDTTMGALDAVAKPYIQDSITERRARAGRRHPQLPAAAALPRQHDRADARAAARA